VPRVMKPWVSFQFSGCSNNPLVMVVSLGKSQTTDNACDRFKSTENEKYNYAKYVPFLL